MNNKIISLLLVSLSFTMGSTGIALTVDPDTKCAGYDDVLTSSGYCDAIEYVTDQGIFSGSYTIDQMITGEKYFKPDENINRAEVLKVILRAGGDAIAYDKIQTFGHEVGFIDIDANTTDWWLGFLKQAKKVGIVRGYSDGSFRAVNPVSRVEYLKMLLEASPSAAEVHTWTIENQGEMWADTPIAAWYATYVAFANHYNLFANLTGCPAGNGNICPDQPILRAEAAQMIYNYKNNLGLSLGIVPIDPTQYAKQDCRKEGKNYNATVIPPTQCCEGLISYFPIYSRNENLVGAGGVCLAYEKDLESALAIYNTLNPCTTNPDLAQNTTDLPYKNGNFNGYSFPMTSYKSGCGARCDVNLDTQTATVGWMCTGLLPSN